MHTLHPPSDQANTIPVTPTSHVTLFYSIQFYSPNPNWTCTSQLSWATSFHSPNCMGHGPVGMISEILHLCPLPSSANDPDEMWTSYKFIAFNEPKHAPHLKHVLVPHLKHAPHLKHSPHLAVNMHFILNMHLPFTMNNLSIPHIPRTSGVSAWSVCD